MNYDIFLIPRMKAAFLLHLIKPKLIKPNDAVTLLTLQCFLSPLMFFLFNLLKVAGSRMFYVFKVIFRSNLL